MKFVATFWVFILLAIKLQASTIDTLKVGYYHSPPFVVQHEQRLTGVSFWLWQEATREMQIPIEWVDFSKKQKPLKAIISALKKGDISATVNPLTITSERYKYLSFSHPFYTSNLTIATQEKSTWLQSLDFIKSFFSFSFFKAVATLLLVVLFFGVLIWFFERRNENSHFQRGIQGIFSGLWWSAVTMTTVGYGDKYPKTLGGKTVALIWMFSAIMILSGITASIASSLTVNKLHQQNLSLSDFKDQKLGTVASSATQRYLNKNFYWNHQAYPTLYEGLLALDQGEVDAFVYDEPFIQYYLLQHSSFEALEIVPARFNVELYGFGFSSSINDSLLRDFNHQIIRLKESKEWENLLSKYQLSEI